MAHRIGIYYNESAVRDFMRGSSISNIEQDIMMKKLEQIKAEFLQAFGIEGSFTIKQVTTHSRRSRTTFRIVASDSKTTAILKRHPRWLEKFI